MAAWDWQDAWAAVMLCDVVILHDFQLHENSSTDCQALVWISLDAAG